MNKKLWIYFTIRILLSITFLIFLSQIGITWHDWKFYVIMGYVATVVVLTAKTTLIAAQSSLNKLFVDKKYKVVDAEEIK